MNSLLSFFQGLGQLLLHSFWLMGIFWLMAIIVLKLVTNHSAKTKQWILIALLFSSILAFAFLAGIGILSPNASSTLLPNWKLPNTFGSGTWIQEAIQYCSILFSFFYIIGIIYQFVYLNHQVSNLKAQKKIGSEKVPIQLKLFVEEQRFLLGIKKKVGIIIRDNITTACTIGFWKPIIMLPAAAIAQLTPYQLESILLHELSHIQKLDFLTNWLLVLLERLFFFNPFVKKFTRLIREYREQSSDELVLQFKYNPLSYAEALLYLAKYENKANLLVVSATDGTLQRRIEKILFNKRQTVKFPLVQAFSIALMALVLTVSIDRMPASKKETAVAKTNNKEGNSEIQIIPVSYGEVTAASKANRIKQENLAPSIENSDEEIVSSDANDLKPLQVNYLSDQDAVRAYSLEGVEFNKEVPATDPQSKLEPYIPKNSFEYQMAIEAYKSSDPTKEALINEIISEINLIKSNQQLEKELGVDLSKEKEKTLTTIKSKIDYFNKVYPNQLGSISSLENLSQQLASLKLKSKSLDLKLKKENAFAEYKYIIELSSDSTGKKTVVF